MKKRLLNALTIGISMGLCVATGFFVAGMIVWGVLHYIIGDTSLLQIDIVFAIRLCLGFGVFMSLVGFLVGILDDPDSESSYT